MKKKLLLVSVLICTLLMTSCMFKSKEDFPKQEQKEKANEKILFNIAVAQNTVINYMDGLMNEEANTMDKLLSDKVKEDKSIRLPKSLKCKSYKIDDISQIGLKGNFTMKAVFTDMERPLAILEQFIIEVSNEDTGYKITKIVRKRDKEIFAEGMSLRIRNDGDVNTYLVIDKEGVPQYAVSKEDKGANYQIKTPKEAFNSVCINYNGDKMVFSKGDKDTYVGLVIIDYAIATQAPQEGEQKGSQATDKEKNQVRETAIGKKIISLDYIMGTQVEYSIFSLEEEFVVVQYNRHNQGRFISIYDTAKGELLDLKLDKKFPMDKVEIVYASLNKEVVNIEVVAKENIDKTDNKMLGMWKINLKTREISKI